VSGVSKDEADSGTSWFSRRCEHRPETALRRLLTKRLFTRQDQSASRYRKEKAQNRPRRKINFLSRFNPIDAFRPARAKILLPFFRNL
jgi:hypothetical protein